MLLKGAVNFDCPKKVLVYIFSLVGRRPARAPPLTTMLKVKSLQDNLLVLNNWMALLWSIELSIKFVMPT